MGIGSFYLNQAGIPFTRYNKGAVRVSLYCMQYEDYEFIGRLSETID